MMTFEAFKKTLSLEQPPASVSAQLQAMWVEANGDWARAHRIVQDIDDADAAWVHAYLHRKEGDRDNAAYWYRRAGQRHRDQSLEEEWEHIVRTLLDR
jgi:hypothetical protein